MKKEQMQSLLDTWYRDRDEAPRDADSIISRVMAKVPQTPQRSRWWPFPVFYRRTRPPTATESVEYQPSPIPATNGHTPTVIGRTSSMLSPAKAITAGALILAIGGVLLIAQPFAQRASVPSATIDTTLMAPSPAVEGSFTIWERAGSRGEREPIEDLGSIEQAIFDIEFVSSDSRLSGSGTLSGTDWFAAPTGYAGGTNSDLGFGTIELSNEDGRWTGTYIGIDDISPVSLTGEDGYEGLIASVVMDFGSTNDRGFVLTGAIAPAFMLAGSPTTGGADQ